MLAGIDPEVMVKAALVEVTKRVIVQQDFFARS
jgi:hypothetical protein